MKRILYSIILLALLWGWGSVAVACPSCYGDPQSPMTEGMNAAILFLLGVTGTVLTTVTVFFVYLRRKWLNVNSPFRNILN